MRAKICDFTLNYFLGAVILIQTAFATLNGTSTSTFQITNNNNNNKTLKIQNNDMQTMLNSKTEILSSQNTIILTTTAFTEITPFSSSSSSTPAATTAAATTKTKTTNLASTSSSSSSISTGEVIYSRKYWTKNEDSSKKTKFTQSQIYNKNTNHHHEHHWGPFFEEPLLNASQGALQLVTHLSTEAALNCRVGMLKDKTVMWVRRTTEKVSLLTVGNVTYSGDPRISVKFQYPNNWRLLINPVHKEDAGLYMCQVSTHPPRLFITNLTVLDPPMRVIDEKGRNVHDRYYKAGSTIDLTCQINKYFIELQKNNLKQNLVRMGHKLNENELTGIEIFKYITWKKDNDLIKGEAVSNKSHSGEWLNIRLIIPHANFLDNGLYKCSIAKLYETVVQVQILTGELPAAVQHNKSSNLFTEINFITITIMMISYLITINLIIRKYHGLILFFSLY